MTDFRIAAIQTIGGGLHAVFDSLAVGRPKSRGLVPIPPTTHLALVGEKLLRVSDHQLREIAALERALLRGRAPMPDEDRRFALRALRFSRARIRQVANVVRVAGRGHRSGVEMTVGDLLRRHRAFRHGISPILRCYQEFLRGNVDAHGTLMAWGGIAKRYPSLRIIGMTLGALMASGLSA